MDKIVCRRSRGRCILLGLAAVAVVVFCVAVDMRLRWTGLRRDGFWAAGILVYAVLLNAAIGPTIDYRDRPPADVSVSGARFATRTRLASR